MILTALVDCAGCDETYQGSWEVDADDIQDLDEAPVEAQECPACGHKQKEEWPGWVNHTEAGLPTRWDQGNA